MSAAATDAREYHAIHGIHIILPPSRIVDSRRFSRLQKHIFNNTKVRSRLTA